MTDAPERLWVWGKDDGSWLLIDRECLAPDTATEYVRKDATFTADDLRRAWEMGRDAAALAAWQSGAKKQLAHLNAWGALTPPDDLPARVKEGRDA